MIRKCPQRTAANVGASAEGTDRKGLFRSIAGAAGCRHFGIVDVRWRPVDHGPRETSRARIGLLMSSVRFAISMRRVGATLVAKAMPWH